MRIIEIAALENGAHRNQLIDADIQVPGGWATIPDSMTIPDTFPFVDIEVDGQMVVSMAAGTMPEPDPTPAQPAPVTQTQLALAELAETESAHDLENKLALAELAEMIGGTSNG